jgi:inosine-uridine nucleoside N-ribohydrolase
MKERFFDYAAGRSVGTGPKTQDVPAVPLRMTIRILFALVVALVLAQGAAAADRDVILTTDCGAEIDDQFAIAYLTLIPQVHIKGIVTTHAPNLPKKSESSAECVKDVLDHLNAGPLPPIFAGSSVPLAGRAPLENAGVDFMLKTSRSYSPKNRLVIITIGATTDVASAFLADASIADRVEILTMGFDSWPRGGDPWNIKNDPLAYQVILDSSAPVTIGSSDVCQRHLRLDNRTAEEMLTGHGRFAEWLNGKFQVWLAANADLAAQVVKPQTWVIWDTVTAAHLMGFTTSETHPRPALNLSMLTFSFPKTTKTIQWITTIDSAKMWPDFVGRLDKLNAEQQARRASN